MPSEVGDLGIDLPVGHVVLLKMIFPTTISIIAKVDMQDPSLESVYQKIMPGACLRLGTQRDRHRFTRDAETHRFTVTAPLEAGDHRATLEFMDDHTVAQGAIRVLSVYLQGTPMGQGIYQCEYLSWETGETVRSHTYMGQPGVWSIGLRVPVRGVGFV